MHAPLLVVKSAFRAPLRALMTVLTVGIMIAGFIFPRTLIEAQAEGIRQTPHDRVVTRSKHGWSGSFPASYAERVRERPDVRHVTGLTWTGFKLPGKDDLFFESVALEARPFVDMHDELVGPAEQKEAFVADERGAMVSQVLAEELGWKLGDRIVLQSRQMPGEWEVHVRSIVRSKREGFGRRSLWVHYSYFNRTLPRERQDRMTLLSAEVFEPNEGGRIAREIDREFAHADPTLSQEDHVMAAANAANFSAIVTAVAVLSYLFLVVVATVLANTLAMSVRERTRELGVMRALGFGPRQLAGFVLAEALLLGLLGGGAGLAIAYPLFEGLVSRVLAEAIGFQPIVIHPRAAVGALGLAVLLALVAAFMPAYRVLSLRVTEALTRVG